MSLDSASDELRETFKLALRRFPAAVSVITSADQDRRHGMTATAVTSLSLDPPSLIVCINQATLLHDIQYPTAASLAAQRVRCRCRGRHSPG